jgi:acetolactate synthase-1/2/3 large subunit
MKTVGMYLAELLAAYGVEVIFGIPGVHTVELYRGLPNTSIRHVTPRHEQGAGFMADGYARVTGRPGVCFIITGPGMTNIATAMGQAYADSVPMLVISSVNALGQIGSGEGWLHELQDQRQLVRQVSAFSHTVTRPEELAKVVARAFALFSGSRPRPVHIELPLDVITASAEHLPPIAQARAALPTPPGPSQIALREAARLLNEARSPLLLLGGGAADAEPFARALAEILDAPAVMTVNGRGLLPPDHPLAVPGSPSMPPVMDLIERSDVILAAGTEMGPTDYDFYETGRARFRGRSIRIDIDAQQLMRGQATDLPIIADASDGLAALLPLVQAARHDGASRAAAARDRLLQELSTSYRACLHLLETVRDSLPDSIIVGDSTQPGYAGCVYFASAKPRSWFCASTGYGTLGHALPAAIGAQLAAPDRPVVCVIGDGGLQFSLPELGSAREIEAPVILLLWNNRGYGEIKSYMISKQIQPIGVDIFTPDFQLLAKGFGCEAVKLGDPAELPALLRAARERRSPTLIEIDEQNYVAGYAG